MDRVGSANTSAGPRSSSVGFRTAPNSPNPNLAWDKHHENVSSSETRRSENPSPSRSIILRFGSFQVMFGFDRNGVNGPQLPEGSRSEYPAEGLLNCTSAFCPSPAKSRSSCRVLPEVASDGTLRITSAGAKFAVPKLRL